MMPAGPPPNKIAKKAVGPTARDRSRTVGASEQCRATTSSGGGEARPAVVYFVPERIQKKRLAILKKCAASMGFGVAGAPSTPDVTHIVTDFEEEQQVLRTLKVPAAQESWHMVNTKWFTDSAKAKRPLPVTQEYRLKPVQQQQVTDVAAQGGMRQSYACQRPSKLEHCNQRFAKALETLALNAELLDGANISAGNYPRSIAFRKASAVLKALPREIASMDDVLRLKDIGSHSLKVIRDVLEMGYSEEVKAVQDSEWFQTVNLFTNVYGVGPSTANKWYESGLRTIEDVRNSFNDINTRGDKRIEYGVAFFEDLSTPVTFEDAQHVLGIVTAEARTILPEVEVTITGGFRRGKKSGHDVDFLLSHPQPGKEVGFLEQLVAALQRKGHALHCLFEKAPPSEEFMLHNSRQNSTMDNFEKCFMIFRLPRIPGTDLTGSCESTARDFQGLCDLASEEGRTWRAVRVDLIVCPASQLAYALVGWTGNKQFNQSIRQYAKKKMNMKLTSHGLFDMKSGKWLPAKTEEDVFRHLNLEYLHPHHRNP